MVEVTLWRGKVAIWRGVLDLREPHSIGIFSSEPTPENLTVGVRAA